MPPFKIKQNKRTGYKQYRFFFFIKAFDLQYLHTVPLEAKTNLAGFVSYGNILRNSHVTTHKMLNVCHCDFMMSSEE